MPTLSRVAWTGDNAGSFTKSFSAFLPVVAADNDSTSPQPVHYIQAYRAGVLPGWSIESPALKGTSEYGIVRAVHLTTLTALTGTGASGAGGTLALKRYRAGSATHTIASLAFDTGVDTVASVPKEITLSSTLANIKVLFGDLLVAEWIQGSTGLASIAGIITVDLI